MTEPNLINFLQSGIREHLNQVDQDAQLGRELFQLLRDHVKDTRNIDIYSKRNDNDWYVYQDGLLKFQSVSCAACFEWALKQPVKAAKDE